MPKTLLAAVLLFLAQPAFAQRVPPGSTASCSNAVASLQTCDAAGVCTTVRWPCTPFACDAENKTCAKECVTSKNCATASECNQNSAQCVYVGNICATNDELTTPDGKSVSCSPYACAAGACRSSCSQSFDCAAGHKCHDGRCVAK